jgi:hypothetical protein
MNLIDLEGRCYSLAKVLYQYLIGGAEQNHGGKLRLVGEPAKIWTKHLKSYEHYCYPSSWKKKGSHTKLLNIHEDVRRNFRGTFTAI